jgi:hypothetical protein
MDDLTQNSESQIPPEEELSHTDKMTGIFTEPSATFEKIAKFPVKTSDWILPVILLFIIISLTQILVMSNEEIYFQAKQKQEEQLNKTFDKMVESGQMTREEANKQIDSAKERMAMGRGPVGWIFQTVAIFIFGFISVFLVVLIHFLLAKFALKGNGGYTSALVANGLPAYIIIIQVVITAIIAMSMNQLMTDLSAASLMDADKSTFTGWVLGKIAPFSIWAYAVVSIGLAKMFKSASTKKYYFLVFGVWILGSLLLWGIGKAVPFLSWLTQM